MVSFSLCRPSRKRKSSTLEEESACSDIASTSTRTHQHARTNSSHTPLRKLNSLALSLDRPAKHLVVLHASFRYTVRSRDVTFHFKVERHDFVPIAAAVRQRNLLTFLGPVAASSSVQDRVDYILVPIHCVVGVRSDGSKRPRSQFEVSLCEMVYAHGDDEVVPLDVHVSNKDIRAGDVPAHLQARLIWRPNEARTCLPPMRMFDEDYVLMIARRETVSSPVDAIKEGDKLADNERVKEQDKEKEKEKEKEKSSPLKEQFVGRAVSPTSLANHSPRTAIPIPPRAEINPKASASAAASSWSPSTAQLTVGSSRSVLFTTTPGSAATPK